MNMCVFSYVDELIYVIENILFSNINYCIYICRFELVYYLF